MTIKLHGFPLSPRAFKTLFAAEQFGVPYELVPIDFARGDTRTPAYTAMNPNQRMPVMDHDGFYLWESNAIINYLAEQKPDGGYLPKDLRTRVLTQQWQFWDSNHWDPAAAVFMFENVVKKIFGRGDADPVELRRGAELMGRLAPVLDGQLAKTRYVVGDRLTVADVSLGGTVVSADQAGMPLSEYRGIQRWLADLRAMPGWQKAAALMKPPG
ncbi:MAG: glutathione S-transferase family protein [Alphaproteobacteria bacterium]|nr:glutathione S-transferase family protein [Alphaproteobacteria bacterium]MBL7097663.1 glutathione S-transferase family protein [Alphaproteobacteria bacterium]